MKTKKTFHSAITGKFVSKDFAKENPDTTVEITTCDLEQELLFFQTWIVKFGKDIKSTNLVKEYLKR